MFDWNLYLSVFSSMLVLAVVAWVLSIIIKNVSIVDSLWSLFFAVAAISYGLAVENLSAKGVVVIALVLIWALRLSIYITARNWGDGEDYRYQAIRRRNDPGFAFKSLYIVFGLQAVLAWIISLPLMPAILSSSSLGGVDMVALALWTVGFVFEAGGDYQLARFRKDPDSAGKVLNTGFWRYTRHPNYFGDCCIWWAYFLFAVTAGGWWSIIAPLLMTILLLKVSGVSLLEKTITSRRPEYADYQQRTSAFFPLPPKDL